MSPILVRALRSSLIEVMSSDYVTTGVAMGLRPVTLLFSYLLRNGLTPFISVLGLNVGWLIGGTIIIEQVFGDSGASGSLLITSILTRDYSIIQFVALVLALLVIVVNLLTDLTYALLDPRVSFRDMRRRVRPRRPRRPRRLAGSARAGWSLRVGVAGVATDRRARPPAPRGSRRTIPPRWVSGRAFSRRARRTGSAPTSSAGTSLTRVSSPPGRTSRSARSA